MIEPPPPLSHGQKRYSSSGGLKSHVPRVPYEHAAGPPPPDPPTFVQGAFPWSIPSSMVESHVYERPLAMLPISVAESTVENSDSLQELPSAWHASVHVSPASPSFHETEPPPPPPPTSSVLHGQKRFSEPPGECSHTPSLLHLQLLLPSRYGA